MSETNIAAPAVEPGGWLGEHQRAHCAGGSAMKTYQGLISDEIVLPQSVADNSDPLQMVLAASAFTDAMQNQAYFIAGEFAPEAMWSYYAHDYLMGAKAGGHAKYFASRGHDEVALRCCASALKSMLADPHLEVFNLMVRLKRAAPSAARKIAAQKGHRTVAAAIRDLDRRLEELEQVEPLTPRHKTWLKSLRKLKVVPDAEINQHLNRIAGVNPLRLARRDEAARSRAQHERDDPTYKAAKALCEMAGLQFTGLRPGGFAPMRTLWPEGPERAAFMFRVETDRGPRGAAFYTEGGLVKRRLAVLLEHGNALPIGSLTLSRRDYERIVPTVRR
jgi:hypothetical protein